VCRPRRNRLSRHRPVGSAREGGDPHAGALTQSGGKALPPWGLAVVRPAQHPA
jgi:hypothetical protein